MMVMHDEMLVFRVRAWWRICMMLLLLNRGETVWCFAVLLNCGDVCCWFVVTVWWALQRQWLGGFVMEMRVCINEWMGRELPLSHVLTLNLRRVSLCAIWLLCAINLGSLCVIELCLAPLILHKKRKEKKRESWWKICAMPCVSREFDIMHLELCLLCLACIWSSVCIAVVIGLCDTNRGTRCPNQMLLWW
jgi:hypothetical protein